MQNFTKVQMSHNLQKALLPYPKIVCHLILNLIINICIVETIHTCYKVESIAVKISQIPVSQMTPARKGP
jgi:hypothetical protein